MTIAELTGAVQAYDPSLDGEWLQRVYEVADRAHDGQRRASGESYIEHPLAVAGILAELEMDRQTIAAALLHDVVEDTSITSEQVAAQFGEEIATPRRRRHQADPHPLPIEGRRAGREPAQDVHGDGEATFASSSSSSPTGCTTCGRSRACRRRSSQSIARETLDIYAPIAHRLGIWKIKWEIEDECLRYLDPEGYPRNRRARRQDATRARSRRARSDRAPARRVRRA